MYLFDIINIFVFLTGLINIVYGLIIYSRNRNNITNFWFFLLATSVFLWVMSMFFYRGSSVNVILWSRLLYFTAATIPLSFLYFTYSFPEEKIKFKFWQKYLLPIPFFFVIFLSLYPNLLIEGASTMANKENIIFFNHTIYYFYSAYITGYFIWGYINLILKHFKISGERRFQLNYIIIGTVPSSIIASITNLLLPSLGIFEFNWVGQFMVVLMMSSIFYAMLKYHLFNIKVVATELLVSVVWIVILLDLLTADTLKNIIFEGSLLIITIFFGILIIRSVIKEVQTREKIQALALELKSANDKLKEMDQIKSDFVTIASHQLRTPLTAIKGYASLMLEGSYGKVPEKMKDPLSKLFRSSERMVVMVGDFLNVSRIERGKIDYEFTKFDVLKIVKELFEEFKLSMEKEGRSDPKLYFDTEVKGEVFVNGDEGKIKQVLSNLIDNAIKYTPVHPNGPSGFVKIIFTLPKDKNVALVTI
ncbi:MAG: hypothetical protein NUV40_03985, partial [Patescibacteria group bacterium]|nr:hypothetical protein [Patescibacteria group bacterium]